MILKLVRQHWKRLANIPPLYRGMLSYAILWPSANLVEQLIESRNLRTIDLLMCARFSLYGGCFIAPLVYGWVKLTSAMWPYKTFKYALLKVMVEQISIGPFTVMTFFFFMTLLEMKTFHDAVQEVHNKFYPTFLKSLLVWPALQTINFSLIPEHSRVVFVSLCSFFWTIFLAFMKSEP